MKKYMTYFLFLFLITGCGSTEGSAFDKQADFTLEDGTVVEVYHTAYRSSDDPIRDAIPDTLGIVFIPEDRVNSEGIIDGQSVLRVACESKESQWFYPADLGPEEIQEWLVAKQNQTDSKGLMINFGSLGSKNIDQCFDF